MKKKCISLTLSLALTLGLASPALAATTCPTCSDDVAPAPQVTQPAEPADPVVETRGAWYADALTFAQNKGLFQSIPSQFQANQPVSRDIVAEGLYVLAGRTPVSSLSTFADVGVAAWYAPAVAWAQQQGIVQGRTDVTFAPNDNVTRAELCVMLERFLQSVGHVPMPGNLAVFPDRNLVPAYAQSAMATCVGYQFIQGSDGYLDPSGLCTWAQFVTILQRVSVLLGDQMATTTPTQPETTQPETTQPETTQPETSTSTSTKEEPQRAKVVQDARARMTNNRGDYASDAAFANFREVAVGNIAPGVLYRSASPINPDPCRNGVADSLLKASGAKTVVNLADCRLRYQDYPGYTGTYYSTRNIVSLNMGWEYLSDAFSEDMHNGLEFLAEEEGPYLIHGDCGIERTGFVCMVLEALMGAKWTEIRDDYMLSYENCCGVKKNSKEWQDIAAATVTADMLALTGLSSATELSGANLAQAAQTYLTVTVGLSAQQIATIKTHLSTPVKK